MPPTTFQKGTRNNHWYTDKFLVITIFRRDSQPQNGPLKKTNPTGRAERGMLLELTLADTWLQSQEGRGIGDKLIQPLMTGILISWLYIYI